MYQSRVAESGAVGTAGGSGYTVVSNVAQAGAAAQISLSATDGNVGSAYIGMRLQVVGGAGIGLFGIIATYNAGTKVATVTKPSDGTAGWDHVVPGTTFVAPNSTSTYLIEPAISYVAPTTTNAQSTLSAAIVASEAIYAETSAQYTAVATTTESDGTGATFDVTRNGDKYYVTANAAGTGYSRLDQLVIPGASLGGATTAK